MTHILVDTANTFFRARHVVRGDASEKIGMAIHIMFNSVKKAWQDFDGSHVVFCLEGRSWRKDHYAPYKRNRKELVEAMSEKEKEENDVFWECYDDFTDFIRTKTNVTVLQNPRTEADPGVRTKGTKNKIGLTEAYADRKEKGYTWNNLMLSKWVDHDGKEHRVMEDYERNRLLVDLHAQPEAVIEEMDQTIAQAMSENKAVDQVGVRFMRFCAKYDLNRISEQAQLYVEPFNARLV